MSFLKELIQFFIEEIMRGCDTKIDNIFSPYNSHEQMHQQMHEQMHQQQIHEQTHQQHVQEHMDMAWHASTGIEFGGFDCSSDMNTGMMDIGMF